MADPSNNIFVAVETYNDAGLRLTVNQSPWMKIANKQFLNFPGMEYERGDTVKIKLPIRTEPQDGLSWVGTAQSLKERFETLVITEASVNPLPISDTQLTLFNKSQLNQFMTEYGVSIYGTLAQRIAVNISAAVPKQTYLCFGDGVTLIDSYKKIRDFLTDYRKIGSSMTKLDMVLADGVYDDTIGNGFSQFLPKTNESSLHSWSIGSQLGVDYYQTNLLAFHQSGEAGIAQTALTVDSTVVNADNVITSIVFSGLPPTTSDVFLENDIIRFDKVQPNGSLSWERRIAKGASGVRVTCRVADVSVDSDGGGLATVTVDAGSDGLRFDNTPPLDPQRSLNIPIVAGTTAVALSPHTCGVLIDNRAFYVSMPPLAGKYPYPTSVKTDPTTNISLRSYYGSFLDQSISALAADAIWGIRFVNEYCVRIAINPDQ